MRVVTLGLYAGLLFAVVGPVPVRAVGVDATYATACVNRDVAVLTSIEQKGDAGRIGAQVLSDAYFQLLDARRACREGRVDGALAIYDDIAARLDSHSARTMLVRP